MYDKVFPKVFTGISSKNTKRVDGYVNPPSNYVGPALNSELTNDGEGELFNLHLTQPSRPNSVCSWNIWAEGEIRYAYPLPKGIRGVKVRFRETGIHSGMLQMSENLFIVNEAGKTVREGYSYLNVEGLQGDLYLGVKAKVEGYIEFIPAPTDIRIWIDDIEYVY